MTWLLEIKKRLEAASPGPWTNDNGTICGFTRLTKKLKKPVFKSLHEPQDYDQLGYFKDQDAEFIADAPTDIAHLLEAIRVKDEALEIYAKPDSVLSGSDYQIYGTSSSRQAFDDNGHEAREALAWKPREQCEGNRAMSDEERAAQWKPEGKTDGPNEFQKTCDVGHFYTRGLATCPMCFFNQNPELKP